MSNPSYAVFKNPEIQGMVFCSVIRIVRLMDKPANQIKFSLKTKLILFTIAVGALPLVLGLFLSYIQGDKLMLNAIGSNFHSIARETSTKIDYILGEEPTQNIRLANSSKIIKAVQDHNSALQRINADQIENHITEDGRDWLAGGPKAEALLKNPGSLALKEFLQSDQRTMNATLALFVRGLKGELVSSVNRNPRFLLKENFLDSTSQGKTYLSDVYQDPKSQDYIFAISVPIQDFSGKREGTLTRLYLAKEYFAPMLENVQFGDTGHAMLIDSRGVVIDCKFLPTGHQIENMALLKSVVVPKSGWVLTQGDGHGNFDQSIIGFSPLSGTNAEFKGKDIANWHTFVWQASDEIFAPTRKLMNTTIGWGLLAVALLVAGGIFLSNKILVPINKLRKATARIGSESDLVNVPVETSDEIGELAEAFNKMSNELTRTRSLEKEHLQNLKSTLVSLEKSEEQTRLVVDNVVDAVITINDKGYVRTFNKSAEKIFGYAAEEIVGLKIDKLMPERLAKEHESYLNRYLANGNGKAALGCETTALRKNGDEFPITLEITEYSADNERMFVGVLRDVTEPRRLQGQVHKLSMVVEQSPSPVLITDSKGIIEYVNGSFCQSTGYSPDEVIGKTPALLKSGKHSDKFYEDLWKTITSGKEWVGEFCNKNKDGKLSWELKSIWPLRNSEGEITHFLSTKIDDTERKRAEKKLQEYAHALERSNEALKDFASIASHDLQEPLRKIITFGDRLKSYSHQLSDKGDAYLDKMIGASERMQIFIFDLLEFSRVTTIQKQLTPTNLNQSVEGALYNLEAAITESRAKIEVAKDLPTLPANPLQMQQLFQNLIGNAIKFKRKDVYPYIKISSQLNDEGSWQIFIKDNGIGFEMKYLDRILKPFQRLHGRGTFAGSGMGLAICAKIIQNHHGRLTATSAVDIGTTFKIILPATQDEKSAGGGLEGVTNSTV